jgi:hypothetical protein
VWKSYVQELEFEYETLDFHNRIDEIIHERRLEGIPDDVPYFITADMWKATDYADWSEPW